MCVTGLALLPVEVPVGAIVLGTTVVSGVVYIVWKACCKPKGPQCLPCIPVVGSIAYRVIFRLHRLTMGFRLHIPTKCR